MENLRTLVASPELCRLAIKAISGRYTDEQYKAIMHVMKNQTIYEPILKKWRK